MTKPVWHRAVFCAAIAVLAALVGSLVTLRIVAKRPPPDAPESEEVLAQVGDVPVTTAQFQIAIRERSRGLRSSVDQKKVLLELINEAALTDYAQKQGFCDEPAVQLATRRFLAHRIKERELVPKLNTIAPSDEACRRYYKNHSQEYMVPERRKLAILRLTGSSTMSAAKRESLGERMKEVREAARELPEDVRGFGRLATKYSDHQATRYRGGDVGWVRHEEHAAWPQKVIDAGFALDETGDVSRVVSVDHAFYLVRLQAVRAPTVQPFDDVCETIRVRLMKQRRRDYQEQFMQRILAGRDIVRREQRIAGIVRHAKANRSSGAPPLGPVAEKQGQ